ncbi:Uncharacterized protein GBIM_20178 [Gryllus bimaculatus]|nr:Uncharacterized protein GBIM_20178 [Gryllus bimaculatus]
MKEILLLLLLLAGTVFTKTMYPPDLKTLCTNEEAELEYERLKFYELTQCLANELNATAFRQEILLAGDHDKVDAVIAKVCKHLPQIMECTGEYVSSIGPCMNDNQRREKELWRNLRMMNMEFACGAGRHDLVRFIDDGGIPCIATYRANISQCVDERFPALLKQQSDTQIVKTLASITQRDDRCRNLHEVENCINEVLMKCMPQSSLGIIRQYFSSLDVLFTCANLSTTSEELQPSEYGPPTLDNIARMQEDSITVLTKMKSFLENIFANEKQQREEKTTNDRRFIAILQEQTELIAKITNVMETQTSKSKRRKVKETSSLH